MIGAQSGVTKDVPRGGVVLGITRRRRHRAKKALTLIDSLPGIQADARLRTSGV